MAGWASGLIRQLQISKRREEVHKLPVSRGVESTERGWERHPLLPHCYTFISILTAARCSHFILIYVLHNIICLPENPVLLSGPPNILENFAQFISHLFCFWLLGGRPSPCLVTFSHQLTCYSTSAWMLGKCFSIFCVWLLVAFHIPCILIHVMYHANNCLVCHIFDPQYRQMVPG